MISLSLSLSLFSYLSISLSLWFLLYYSLVLSARPFKNITKKLYLNGGARATSSIAGFWGTLHHPSSIILIVCCWLLYDFPFYLYHSIIILNPNFHFWDTNFLNKQKKEKTYLHILSVYFLILNRTFSVMFSLFCGLSFGRSIFLHLRHRSLRMLNLASKIQRTVHTQTLTHTHIDTYKTSLSIYIFKIIRPSFGCRVERFSFWRCTPSDPVDKVAKQKNLTEKEDDKNVSFCIFTHPLHYIVGFISCKFDYQNSHLLNILVTNAVFVPLLKISSSSYIFCFVFLSFTKSPSLRCFFSKKHRNSKNISQRYRSFVPNAAVLFMIFPHSSTRHSASTSISISL